MEWLLRTVDRIVPSRCVVCHDRLERSRPAVCDACARRLPWWRIVDGCPRCGFAGPAPWTRGGQSGEPTTAGCPGCLADGSALHACRSLMRYEPPIDRWIPAFKRPPGHFGPAPEVLRAIEMLTDDLAQRLASESGERPDLVACVPLHPRRRRRRGFNHAAVVAARLADGLARPFEARLLERVRDTPSQAGLHGAARRANVLRAFRCTRALAPGTRVWLLDDVLTTGRTLDAAADALLEAGAFEVRGLSLAATLPPRRRHGRPGKRAGGKGPGALSSSLLRPAASPADASQGRGSSGTPGLPADAQRATHRPGARHPKTQEHPCPQAPASPSS